MTEPKNDQPSLVRRLIEHHLAGPAPGRADDLVAGQTEREREVHVLVGRGRSNDEVAAELFVSRATVKSHVNHVFAKLGITSRVQAVVLCYEHGLVVPGRA